MLQGLFEASLHGGHKIWKGSTAAILSAIARFTHCGIPSGVSCDQIHFNTNPPLAWKLA